MFNRITSTVRGMSATKQLAIVAAVISSFLLVQLVTTIIAWSYMYGIADGFVHNWLVASILAVFLLEFLVFAVEFVLGAVTTIVIVVLLFALALILGFKRGNSKNTQK